MKPELREKHPDYPFIEFGPAAAFFEIEDIDSVNTVILSSDWYMSINGDLGLFSYDDKESALNDVKIRLFNDWKDYELARNEILRALDKGDIELALRLSHGIGYAQGKSDAIATFKGVVQEVMTPLQPYSR